MPEAKIDEAGHGRVPAEGQERRMRAWDYLHCPAGTPHITVGAGHERVRC